MEELVSFLSSVLIGIGTGILSSYLVTRSWQRKIDKRQYYIESETEIQIICRYADSVITELGATTYVNERAIDTKNLIRIVEDSPYTPVLRLNSQGEKEIGELISLIRETGDLSMAGLLDGNAAVRLKGSILKTEFKILRNWKEYIIPFEEKQR